MPEARLDTPEIGALRAHLEAHNGIKGLSILEPRDLKHAVELFRRDGFNGIRPRTSLIRRGDRR